MPSDYDICCECGNEFPLDELTAVYGMAAVCGTCEDDLDEEAAAEVEIDE